MRRLRALLRLLLFLLAAFLAVSALPGGIMLLAGIYTPPVEQLRGSIFSSFLLPGLALLSVGAGALLAAALVLRGNRFARPAGALAGPAVMSFEFVEVLTIGSPAGPAFVMQTIYFAVGLALVALAAFDAIAGTLAGVAESPSPPKAQDAG